MTGGGLDGEGVTRKDVEGWMRYFDELAEEFVAAHEAIIRKAALSDAKPTHADAEMARAKSYAKGFQDGLKAARKALANELNPPPDLTQPDAERTMPAPQATDEQTEYVRNLPGYWQSGAEPVAWRIKDFANGWMFTGSASTASTHRAAGHVVNPLYIAPPRPLGPDGKPLPGWYYDEDGVCRPYRPDASAGLLIEALEALEALVIDCENKWGDPYTLAGARAAHTTIRARAADRSTT